MDAEAGSVYGCVVAKLWQVGPSFRVDGLGVRAWYVAGRKLCVFGVACTRTNLGLDVAAIHPCLVWPSTRALKAGATSPLAPWKSSGCSHAVRSVHDALRLPGHLALRGLPRFLQVDFASFILDWPQICYPSARLRGCICLRAVSSHCVC